MDGEEPVPGGLRAERKLAAQGNRLAYYSAIDSARRLATRFGRNAMTVNLADVFEVQDEIARSISQALRIKLTPQEEKAIARKQTDNPQAYDYYLRGRQFFHQFRRKGFVFARQMFARAIAAHRPSNTLAHMPG